MDGLVIDWDIILCNVLEYKRNTDSCDSYLHVIITLRPTAPHSSLLANVKFFPELTSELNGWLLATFVTKNLVSAKFRKQLGGFSQNLNVGVSRPLIVHNVFCSNLTAKL